MARTVSLLVLGLVLGGCAAPLVLDKDGALVVIPHEISDTGHIVVETTVNSQGPFRFVIDTGASISVLYEGARKTLGIEPAADAQVHILGMTGNGVFPVAGSVRIAVGTELWNTDRIALLPDATTPDARIGGILGVDFLGRYAIHYSQRDKVLRLYPRELVAERSYLGWSSVPLFKMNVTEGNVGVYAFDIYVGGRRIPTAFDLGASVNLMNRRAARMLGVPTRKVRDVPSVQGVTGKVPITTEIIIWRMRVGDMHWHGRTFAVGSFPIFDALDLNSKPVAIAGTDLFRDRDFIVDFERGRLLVGRPK